MAIQMAQNITYETLVSMFGTGSQETKKVDYLSSKGAKVNTGLFNFKIELNGEVFSETLPALVGKYVSHDAAIQSIMKEKVRGVIESAMLASASAVAPSGGIGIYPPAATEEPLVPATPAMPAWAKSAPSQGEVNAVNTTPKMVKKVVKVPPLNVEITEKKAVPVAEVLPLKDARALSQKVSGTSGGSIYRCVAVGDLNVAIRVQAASVSLRAEFQTVRDEPTAQKMSSMGFTDHGKYLSMHLNIDGKVPYMRVVGAVLLGAGIEFETVATTEGQING